MTYNSHVLFENYSKYPIAQLWSMEGDWGHNSIMLTGNFVFVHVSFLHAMSLY